ncbi:MAG: hypothetical protein AAF773_08985 [Cyanobacteria bacterium P01_D01_bin.115]
MLWLAIASPTDITVAVANDQVHRAAANDFRILKTASTAAPVQRLVMALSEFTVCVNVDYGTL